MENRSFFEIFQNKNRIPVNIKLHQDGTYGSSRSHWHNDLEIGLLISGIVKCYIGGEIQEIRGGQIYLANSGVVHCTIPQYNGVDYSAPGVTLVISYEFLQSIIPGYNEMVFDMKDIRTRQEISLIIFEIIELYRDNNPANEVKILGLVCQILHLLLKNCVCMREELDKSYWKQMESQKQILDYIHTNYNRPLRQSDIAEQFHFSKAYFCRLFKKNTGRNFKSYLTACRLAHGEDMLRKSEITILEIAQDVGFPDEQTFIREFKKAYGTTPGQYRKQWSCPNVKSSP